MKRHLLLLVAGFVFGLLAAYELALLRPDWVPRPQPVPVHLSATEATNVVLYAELHNGMLTGKYFNQNARIVVTQITVEAVPKDENNPFNKFAPRLFDISASARPRSMSSEFSVETGALNPEFHTLRVKEAKGFVTHD